MSTVTTEVQAERRRGARILSGTALGVGLALAVNLLVYLIGNLGAPIMVVSGWAPDGAELTLAEVIGTTITAVAAGGAVLWLLERRWPDPLGRWAIVAAAVASLSAVPLWRLDVDAGSKMALTAMHLLTGAAAITGHSLTRRWR